jgi:hypothetical protein
VLAVFAAASYNVTVSAALCNVVIGAVVDVLFKIKNLKARLPIQQKTVVGYIQ